MLHHKIYTTTLQTIKEGEDRDSTTSKRLRSAYNILKEAVCLQIDEFGGLGVYATTRIRPGQVLPYEGNISRTISTDSDCTMSLQEYLPDQHKNVCIISTRHIGVPTG